MSFQAYFVLLSTILPIIAPIIYIRSMRRGITMPQRMTRFVLLAITIISFVSLTAQRNWAVIGLALVSMIQAVVVFIFSLKYGMGGKNRLDFICLGIAALGILLWQTSGNPLVALYSSIVADVVGCIPALLKTYHLPHTEDWRYFALDTAAGVCAILALSQLSFEKAIYPIYIVLINLVMVVLILARRNLLIKKSLLA